MAVEELSKKLFRLYPWIILFLVLFLILAHFVYTTFIPLTIIDKQVVVAKGMDVRRIAEILENKEIIRSPFYFVLLQKFIFPGEKIKAGSYSFSGNYNLVKVIKTLKRGKGVAIVIPEGKTLKEIEKILQSAGFAFSLDELKISDFPEASLDNYFPKEAPLEGFLAPDTYHFYPDASKQEIIQIILKNFSKKYLPEILKSDLKPYETLILASIVEKEAKEKQDFPIIAGILKKRLKNKMSLDVDTPIVYTLCGGVYCQIKFDSKSLPKNHPYQTYGRIGLPATPIANPSLAAVQAVINPIETNYWYYLTDKSGKAIYAETLKEHQENIKKYLE